MQWDVILRGAKVFDGTGGPGEVVDIAVREGRIAAKGANLPADSAKAVHESLCKALRQHRERRDHDLGAPVLISAVPS